MVMEYKSIIEVAGPLMVVDKVKGVMYNEVVEIDPELCCPKPGQQSVSASAIGSRRRSRRSAV